MSAADQAAAVMPSEDTGRADAPLGEKHEPPVNAAALIKRAPLPKAVAQFVLSDDEMRRTWRTASALAASHLFKDSHQAEQAFGKILIGRDLGLSPTQALQTIDIVEGSIFMRGVLLASFVRKSPDYHYKVLERTPAGCTLLFLGFPQDEAEDGFVKTAGRWWEVLSRETFTVADAQTAGLVRDKGNWKKYPKNMCFWRCISNAVKMEAPDLLGGVPVYTEADEIPPRTALDEGTGDGSAQGLDLGPDVEAILKEAAEKGHAALADRAAIEMMLGDQPPAKVAEFVQNARRELASIPEEAEVVEAREAPQSPVAAKASESTPGPENGREGTAERGQGGEFAAPTDEEQAAADKLGVPIVSQGFLDKGPPRKATPAPDTEAIAVLRRRGENLANAIDAMAEDDPQREQAEEEFEAVRAQVEAMTNVDQLGMPL